MKCAIYADTLIINKTSINLQILKKFKNLQNLQILLKSKFLTLEEEDKKFAGNCQNILQRLSNLKFVKISHEIDPENHPYYFLTITDNLNSKVHLKYELDFLDVANYRVKDNSIETILKTLQNSKVNSLYIKYIGMIKSVKRFGRTFEYPIHCDPRLYMRVL